MISDFKRPDGKVKGKLKQRLLSKRKQSARQDEEEERANLFEDVLQSEIETHQVQDKKYEKAVFKRKLRTEKLLKTDRIDPDMLEVVQDQLGLVQDDQLRQTLNQAEKLKKKKKGEDFLSTFYEKAKKTAAEPDEGLEEYDSSLSAILVTGKQNDTLLLPSERLQTLK